MNAPAPINKAVSTSGAVMVVGGGVAGVQAALDLSALGYKVSEKCLKALNTWHGEAGTP